MNDCTNSLVRTGWWYCAWGALHVNDTLCMPSLHCVTVFKVVTLLLLLLISELIILLVPSFQTCTDSQSNGYSNARNL